jgi:flagellar hook-basal body complex protein FliE
MPTPINSITTPLVMPGQAAAAKPEAVQGGHSFKDFLLQSIHEVNGMQQAADRAVEQLATGGDISPAEVLTAVQKADIAFRMMLQVRNKMVDAFNEVQNLRI